MCVCVCARAPVAPHDVDAPQVVRQRLLASPRRPHLVTATVTATVTAPVTAITDPGGGHGAGGKLITGPVTVRIAATVTDSITATSKGPVTVADPVTVRITGRVTATIRSR